MPKISKKQILVITQDSRLYYDIVINYNQKLKFFVEIEQRFYEIAESLSDKTLNEYNIKIVTDHNIIRKKPTKIYICGDSEENVEDYTKKAYKYFQEQTVKRREVIIVFYAKDEHFDMDECESRDKPKLKMEMSYIYCREVTAGEKTSYYQNDRLLHSFSFQYRKPLVIDNTPENREAIETIYSKIQELTSLLETFLKDSEKIKKYASMFLPMIEVKALEASKEEDLDASDLK